MVSSSALSSKLKAEYTPSGWNEFSAMKIDAGMKISIRYSIHAEALGQVLINLHHCTDGTQFFLVLLMKTRVWIWVVSAVKLLLQSQELSALFSYFVSNMKRLLDIPVLAIANWSAVRYTTKNVLSLHNDMKIAQNICGSMLYHQTAYNYHPYQHL